MAMVRGSNPVWSFVDLTGHQFDDTFYMFVLENEIPYAPATVWHDANGNIPWTNPIQFLANGTLPIDIYWNPYAVYRLEFRQGNTQQDPLIYLVENYVPGQPAPDPIDTVALSTDNQMSNPQFAVVNFENPLSLINVTTQSIEVGPDWFLDLTGTGNVTLTQLPLNSNNETPTNAPYALQIELSGAWTEAVLRQRFQQNGVLWANKYVSFSITALRQVISQSISAQLRDSLGNTLAEVLPTTALDGNFTEYTGYGKLGDSVNTQDPPSAYIDFRLNLPTVANLIVTSLQLVAGDLPIRYPYEQDTIQRQIDHLFHYYKPQLSYKPIPSYLVGWDFPLNPAQFSDISGHRIQPATAIGANKSKYVWDQTLIFQSANSGVGVTGGPAGEIVLTAANTTQMAIIQYLPANIAREILNDSISVNVQAKASTAVNATISLWYTTDANLPNAATGTNDSLIATIGTNGKPATFNGNWTEVPRQKLGDALFTIGTNATTNFNNYGFSGWNLEGAAASNTATFFAIVIGTASVASTETVSFYNVSLCHGDIPTPPAPKTFEQTLKECEYYYEKSYNFSTPPGTAASGNSVLIRQSDEFDAALSVHNWYRAPFTLEYKTIKRSTTPTITFYDIAGNINQIRYTVYDNTNPAASSGGVVFSPSPAQTNIASSGWSILNRSNKRTTYVINTSAPVVQEVGSGAHQGALAAVIDFHYVVDARLGVV